MKLLRRMIVGAAVAMGLTLLYNLPFAIGAATSADISLLRDSAVALQESNPDLAKGLNEYANREESGLNSGISGDVKQGGMPAQTGRKPTGIANVTPDRAVTETAHSEKTKNLGY